MKPMNILIACESSQVIAKAFRERGHNSFSCDLLPCDGGFPEYHFKADGLEIIRNNGGTLQNGTSVTVEKWDLLIAHPPCTRLCNSGALRLYKHGKKKNGPDPVKWRELDRAAALFRDFWNAPVDRICIENPVPHGHAIKRIGVKYSQTIQPYQFGHPESKRTCLWLKNLPLLRSTKVLKKPSVGYWDNQTPSGQNKLGPSKDRWKQRSRTYEGVAEAMAEQWGNANCLKILPLF